MAAMDFFNHAAGREAGDRRQRGGVIGGGTHSDRSMRLARTSRKGSHFAYRGGRAPLTMMPSKVSTADGHRGDRNIVDGRRGR